MALIRFNVPCVLPCSIFVKISMIELISNIGVDLSAVLVIKISVSSKISYVPISITNINNLKFKISYDCNSDSTV